MDIGWACCHPVAPNTEVAGHCQRVPAIKPAARKSANVPRTLRLDPGFPLFDEVSTLPLRVIRVYRPEPSAGPKQHTSMTGCIDLSHAALPGFVKRQACVYPVF